MKQTTHPNFILGIVTLLMLFVGVGLYRSGSSAGFWVWVATGILGAIHWIWAIIDVFRQQNLASQSRVLWSILVIAVPPIGGLMYYAMSKTVRM